MASIVDKDLGNRIVWLRENRGLSQKVAAERIGVGYSTYRSYEDGSRPSPKNINKITSFYKIRRDWLLHGWGDPFNDVTGWLKDASDSISVQNSILAETDQFYDEESINMIVRIVFISGDDPLMQSLQSFIRMLHALIKTSGELHFLKETSEDKDQDN
jgi:transcriptional regulator with XRE-family HTH domain